MKKWLRTLVIASLPVILGAQSCGGGGGQGGDRTAGLSSAALQSSGVALTSGEVQQILAQAVSEAQAGGNNATIAIVDRVGNVLAVFQMNGAAATATVTSGRGVTSGLENATIPAAAAAIAKAITGAYLSSGGNAFSTRTASQIVQENFNPGEISQPGGPLFGVQFSQLPCSDLSVRFQSDNGGSVSATLGPKRSPLGLAADPGGFPLYKNGILVGGVGVMADGVYGLDLNILDVDQNADERIALAATQAFAAPAGITAPFVTVEGKTLRFSDATPANLLSNPALANFAAINGSAGNLTTVRGYYDAGGGALAGTAFGTAASGIRADGGTDFANPNAFVLVDGTNANRYAPIAGTNSGPALSSLETRSLLEEALKVALAARAQIRRPLNSEAQVSIAIVDTQGVVLGLIRTPDAPIFGIDVALQKARTASFASRGNPSVNELTSAGFVSYLNATQSFTGTTGFLSGLAVTARGLGNLARPFYPDGINGNAHGPLSRTINDWSPFSTGLQLDLVATNIVQHLNYVLNSGSDTPNYCTGLPLVSGLPATTRLANGSQIFAGGVPIYRGSTLIGAIGVSGDGIDQDDMVAFLGLQNTAAALGTLNQAPAGLRIDTLTPQGTRLRYVSCPFQPFLNSSATNVCSGI